MWRRPEPSGYIGTAQVLLSPSKCAAELAFRPAAQREEEVLAREREVLAVDVAAPLGAVPGQHGPAQLPRTAHHTWLRRLGSNSNAGPVAWLKRQVRVRVRVRVRVSVLGLRC